MPDKLTREYVVSISGDDNLTDTDINDFIKDLEEWLTDQNTEAPQGGQCSRCVRPATIRTNRLLWCAVCWLRYHR